jgi:prepilin-type N-terminal cleavage/methylation domain-containing protein/prepilin-type processing-associated H-X9-DG protein
MPTVHPSPAHPSSADTRPPGRPAFTLVELLVVIGIISVLIGILLPALSAARKSGQQVRSLSNIRTVVAGFTQYHIDNRGCLPFGYPPAVVDGWAVRAELPTGGTIGFPEASRYPWRLIRYVGDLWSILYSHKDNVPADEAAANAYTISLYPTYGINAYYVGGHTGFFGFDPATGRPNPTGPAVSKITRVRHPTRLIAFADATSAGVPGAGVDDGWFVVTPPRKRGVQWTVEKGKCVPATAGVSMGLPQGRYGRGAACAFVDGHVESLQPDELTDMTYWSDAATGPDWDYAP